MIMFQIVEGCSKSSFIVMFQIVEGSTKSCFIIIFQIVDGCSKSKFIVFLQFVEVSTKSGFVFRIVGHCIKSGAMFQIVEVNYINIYIHIKPLVYFPN